MAKAPNSKFSITIIYNGVPQPLEVNGNQAVQAVLSHALQLFGLQNAPGDLGLYNESNTLLDPNRSVEDSGIVAGTRLQLRAPAQGG